MKNSNLKREFPFSYTKFKEIYSQVPRICVDLIIQDNKGKFVLLKRDVRDSNFNQWHFPGGTVYFREPIETAILRIAKEETGLEVKTEGLVGFLEYLQESRDNQKFHSVSLAVVCTPLQKLDSNSKTYQIFKQVPENMVPEQASFMEKFLNGSWEDPACRGCDDPDCMET